jgi:hypothetical protein
MPMSNERELIPINDTMNPTPPKFGLPWQAVLGVLTIAVMISLIPNCKIIALLSVPIVLGFSGWLVKDDPKAPMLILYDLLLPPEFDPGKDK